MNVVDVKKNANIKKANIKKSDIKNSDIKKKFDDVEKFDDIRKKVDDVKKKVDNKKRTVTLNKNQTKKEKSKVRNTNQKLKRRALNRRKQIRLATSKYFLSRTTTELRAMKIDFFKYLKFVKKQHDEYIPNKLVIYYNKSPNNILYSILWPYVFYLLYRNTNYIININKYWDTLSEKHDKIKERDPEFNPKQLYELDRDLYITARFRRVIYFGITLYTITLGFVIYIVLHYVMSSLCDNIIEFNSYCLFRSILTIIFVFIAFIFHYYLNPILTVTLKLALSLLYYITYFIIMFIAYIITLIIYTIGWIFSKRKKDKNEEELEDGTNSSSFFDVFKFEKSSKTEDENSSGGIDRLKQMLSINTKKQTSSEKKKESKVSTMIANISNFSMEEFINSKKAQYFNPKLKSEETEETDDADNISDIKNAGDFFRTSLKGFDKTDNKKSSIEVPNIDISKMNSKDKDTKPKKIRISTGCKTNMIEDFFLQFKEERLNKDKNILTCIENEKIKKNNKIITDNCKPDKSDKDDMESKLNLDKPKIKKPRKYGTESRCERTVDFTIVLGNFFKIIHNEYVNGSEFALQWYVTRHLYGDYEKKVLNSKRVPKYLTKFEKFILIGMEQIKKIKETVKKASKYSPKEANKEIEKFKEELLNTKDKNRRGQKVNRQFKQLFRALEQYMKGNTKPLDNMDMNASYELSLIGTRLGKVLEDPNSDKSTLRTHIGFLKEDLNKNFITRVRFEIIKPKFIPIIKEYFKSVSAYYVDKQNDKNPKIFVENLSKKHNEILSKSYISIELTDFERIMFFGIFELAKTIDFIEKFRGTKEDTKTEIYVIQNKIRFSKEISKRTDEENNFMKKHIEILKEEYVNNKLGAVDLLKNYDNKYNNDLSLMKYQSYIIKQRVLQGYNIYKNKGAKIQINLLETALKQNFIIKKNEYEIEEVDENEIKQTSYIVMYPAISEYLQKLETEYINKGKREFERYISELYTEKDDFIQGSLSRWEQLIYFINVNKLDDIMERIEDISKNGSEDAYKFINIIRNEFYEDFENEINKSVLFQSLLLKLFDTLEYDIINNTNNINILDTQNKDYIKAKTNKTFFEVSKSIIQRVIKNSRLGKNIGLSEIKFLREETIPLFTKIHHNITKISDTKKLSSYNEGLLIALRSEYLDNNIGELEKYGRNLYLNYVDNLSNDNFSAELSELEKIIFYVGQNRLENYIKSIEIIKNSSKNNISKRINEIEEELRTGVANIINILKKHIKKILKLFNDYYIDDKKDAITNAIKKNSIIKNIMNEEGEFLKNRIESSFKVEGKSGVERQLLVLKQEFNIK